MQKSFLQCKVSLIVCLAFEDNVPNAGEIARRIWTIAKPPFDAGAALSRMSWRTWANTQNWRVALGAPVDAVAKNPPKKRFRAIQASLESLQVASREAPRRLNTHIEQ